MPYGPKDLQAFVQHHQDTIAQVTDLFAKANLSPAEGEGICLYIAGLSAGARQFPIVEEFPEVLAIAWQIGAMFGE